VDQKTALFAILVQFFQKFSSFLIFTKITLLGFSYARNRLRALPILKNFSLTLIQGRGMCIEAKIA
jgi:hypothetical protein